MLPDREKTLTPFRVSQYVARALLGEVYLQMSGYPLQQARYKEAVTILSPIVNAGKYHLMANVGREEQSALISYAQSLIVRSISSRFVERVPRHLLLTPFRVKPKHGERLEHPHLQRL